MYAASMILIIVSGVLYQLFQKRIAPAANPALSLIVSYAASFGLSCALLLIFPLKKSIGAALGDLNPVSLLLALPIVGIELGYLLLYRNGGRLSISMPLISTCITLLLLGIGIFVLGEAPTPKKLIGVGLCLAGVFFLQA
jgi:drug/metabolite transporter (DMT)-like permease